MIVAAEKKVRVLTISNMAIPMRSVAIGEDPVHRVFFSELEWEPSEWISVQNEKDV